MPEVIFGVVSLGLERRAIFVWVCGVDFERVQMMPEFNQVITCAFSFSYSNLIEYTIRNVSRYEFSLPKLFLSAAVRRRSVPLAV